MLSEGVLAAQGEDLRTAIFNFFSDQVTCQNWLRISQATFQTTGLGGTSGRWGPEGTAGNWLFTGCLKGGKHIL